MPNWREILDEVKEGGGAHDRVRRKYLTKLSRHTGRNTIVYYSGWLEKRAMFQGRPGPEINDGDRNGLMAAVHRLDRHRGLDLILHTPGGDMAATESIVVYLRRMFGTDIRVIVPHTAMSAGTMIACASKKILMGKHSCIGPIDPQFYGMSAQAICETWTRAQRDIMVAPPLANTWMPLLQKLHPTIIVDCERAIEWSKQAVKSWLLSGMFEGMDDAEERAENIISTLGSNEHTKTHARHISIDVAREMGLIVEPIEEDEKFQDLVLTVHHCCVQTCTESLAFKIIENQLGVAFIQQAPTGQVALMPG